MANPAAQQHMYSGSRGDAAAFPMMQQSPAPAMMSPSKDPNLVMLCRGGQELVHDVVSRAQEMFKYLSSKEMQLPNNVNVSGQQFGDRKAKVEEQLRHIQNNFKKLKLFYAKVNEGTDQIDMPSEQELVPMVGVDTPERDQSDNYHLMSEQHREIAEQVRLKNQQLKEIIDSIRTIIWEVNTMITMRK